MSDFSYHEGASGPTMSAPKDLCLLSLDGGGVRGLSTLLILKRIMEAVNPEDPPNPCDYFHMIGGTSTGGLIALMLGRLRMTVDQCIDAYSEMSPDVFTKVKHRMDSRGNLQGRFDDEALEDHIKHLLVQRLMSPNELLKDRLSMGSCKTFVCATSKQTGKPTILSSYYNERRGADMYSITKIWEAARATSAATTFFDEITIGDETFVDGATGANNPIRYMLAEARDTFNEGYTFADGDIKCIVSIGTGMPSLTPFGQSLKGVATALKDIATDTEQEADNFQKEHTALFRTGKAFRFNVLQGLEKIGLEEVSRWPDIKAVTRLYVQKEEVHVQIKKCATNLKEREWVKKFRGQLLSSIRPSITTLHDDETHTSMNQLQWLTHTRSYQLWHKSESGIIWYQLPRDSPDDTRKGIGAAIAYHTAGHYNCFAGNDMGVGPIMRRALYHQCDRQQSGDDFDPDAPTYTRPEDVLWSLICQSLILDCETVQSLNRRLLELPEVSRRALQAAMEGHKSQPISVLFNILTQTVQARDFSMILALDNIHLIQGNTTLAFWNTMRGFVSMMHQREANCILSAVFTGCRTNRLEDYLQGIATIDDDTERDEWNARRNQVSDADEGTNEWLWVHDQYRRWDAADSAVLWIEGKPGSGKSVLARSIQRKLSSVTSDTYHTGSSSPRNRRVEIVTSKLPAGSLVADWFYSTRMEEVGMSHLSLLRSILYQLLQQNDQLFYRIAPIYRLYSLAAETEQAWSIAECERALRYIGESGLDLVCIVDAMDEAADNTIEKQPRSAGNTGSVTILSMLCGLGAGLKDSRMKFIVLSRPDVFIEMDFKRIKKTATKKCKIVLEQENRGDIAKIVSKGLDTLREAFRALDSDSEDDGFAPRQSRKHRGLPSGRYSAYRSQETDLNSIGEFLCQNAQGVILWVKIVLGDLEDLAHGGLINVSDLKDHAKTLPPHIEEDGLYEHIVKKIQQRTHGSDVSRARSVFMLIHGSAVLARPLLVREVWEALAIPENTSRGLSSTSDPITSNRVNIKSWTEFRRHLRILCGPFVEINRSPNSSDGFDHDDIGPDDIVQFIHRTVKDFLQIEGRSGPLHFSEEQAIDHIKSITTTYLQLTFPQTGICYGPRTSQWQIEGWLDDMDEYVTYLESKILLQFCLFVLQKRLIELDHLLQSTSFVLLQNCPYSVEDIDVDVETRRLYPAFNTEARKDDPFVYEAIALGESFRIASMKSFVIATHNLLEICSLITSWNYSPGRTSNLMYAVKNGTLATAIIYDMKSYVKILTKSHRHQAGLFDSTGGGWPIRGTTDGRTLDHFIQLAVRSGSVDTVNYLLDHTDRFYARNAAIKEFAVTSRNLSLSNLNLPKYRDRECSYYSISSFDLVSFGLLDENSDELYSYKSEQRHRRKQYLRSSSTSEPDWGQKHDEFSVLKEACLRIAHIYRNKPGIPATRENVKEIEDSLHAVTNSGNLFESNTNPYIHEDHNNAQESDDESENARNMQPDAYKRFFNRHTREHATGDLPSRQSSRSISPRTRSHPKQVIKSRTSDAYSDSSWDSEYESDERRFVPRPPPIHKERRNEVYQDFVYQEEPVESSSRFFPNYDDGRSYDSRTANRRYDPYDDYTVPNRPRYDSHNRGETYDRNNEYHRDGRSRDHPPERRRAYNSRDHGRRARLHDTRGSDSDLGLRQAIFSVIKNGFSGHPRRRR